MDARACAWSAGRPAPRSNLRRRAASSCWSSMAGSAIKANASRRCRGCACRPARRPAPWSRRAAAGSGSRPVILPRSPISRGSDMAIPVQDASLFVSERRPPSRNPGYTRMFARGRLSLGLFFPIEAFAGDMPAMRGQVALAQHAEAAGFAALWFRDVPLRVPSFGDTGQVYDPWVWLAHVSASTSRIALATGSIVLPLRHPLHVAKAAASIDRLSGGRLVLGVASGDRPEEFPAFGLEAESRGEIFRERFELIRRVHATHFPEAAGNWGQMAGADIVPKPLAEG